jgi:hypothetical protein
VEHADRAHEVVGILLACDRGRAFQSRDACSARTIVARASTTHRRRRPIAWPRDSGRGREDRDDVSHWCRRARARRFVRAPAARLRARTSPPWNSRRRRVARPRRGPRRFWPTRPSCRRTRRDRARTRTRPGDRSPCATCVRRGETRAGRPTASAHRIAEQCVRTVDSIATMIEW